MVDKHEVCGNMKLMINKPSEILNIDNVSPTYARSAGGKFAGLVRVKPLIDKYVAQYNVPLAIPETYGIKIDTPHNHVFDAAMRAMDACGGNVAVRSSADIEDVSGKTYSGAFESVLNVDNKDKMKEALDVVYGSAKNVPGAKMGIVIQRMIANPEMAGVLYSQDFNGDPMTVINYTIGRPANMLLVNRDKGDLTKISKYVSEADSCSLRRFQFPDMHSVNDRETLHTIVFDNHCPPLPLMCIKAYGLEKIFNLAALGNHMESDLGYPVDVEFAIEKNGTINVLQQRPYIINPNYVVTCADNGDWIGYNAQSPIIRGQVKIVDNIHNSEELNAAKQNGTFVDKILLAKHGKNYDSFAILTYFEDMKSVLSIDAGYRLQHDLYGHYGNGWRERGTPFLSTKRAADFVNVNDGDMMEIDIRTGMFKIISQKIR